MVIMTFRFSLTVHDTENLHFSAEFRGAPAQVTANSHSESCRQSARMFRIRRITYVHKGKVKLFLSFYSYVRTCIPVYRDDSDSVLSRRSVAATWGRRIAHLRVIGSTLGLFHWTLHPANVWNRLEHSDNGFVGGRLCYRSFLRRGR